MKSPTLSFQTRKALQVHVGEHAGVEIAEMLQQLAVRIEQLERNKVNITRVVPELDTAVKAHEVRRLRMAG